MPRPDQKRRKNALPIYGIFAFIFVAAQVFGTAHAAEHIDPAHQHDEAPCAIQFAVDTARGFVAPVTNTDPCPSITADAPPIQQSCEIRGSSGRSNQFIRGPPSL